MARKPARSTKSATKPSRTAKAKGKPARKATNNPSYTANIDALIPVVQYGNVEQRDGGVSLNWRKPRTSKRFETIVPDDQLITAKIASEDDGGFVVRMVKTNIVSTEVNETEISGKTITGVDGDGNGVFLNAGLAATLGLEMDYTSSEEV